MKINKIKHPRMVEGNISAKLRDEEEQLTALPPESPKMMAKGGPVEDEASEVEVKPDKGFGKIIRIFAEGGEVTPEAEEVEEQHSSVAAAIMAKKRKQMPLFSDSDEDDMLMMAEGGEVDIEENGAEQANHFDKRNNAILKENYDSDLMDVSQPTDSNEHGDKREMIKSIRSKMIAKRIAGSR